MSSNLEWSLFYFDVMDNLLNCLCICTTLNNINLVLFHREGDPASKVFFTCDFNSQQFLCLLIGSKQHMK